MGFLKNLFGGKKGGSGGGGTPWKCGQCSATIQMPPRLMSIISTDINRFALGGLAGYCPSCNTYLCSKHLEFINPSNGEAGPWMVGCKRCRTAVTTGP
jgi:hypothetical protein